VYSSCTIPRMKCQEMLIMIAEKIIIEYIVGCQNLFHRRFVRKILRRNRHIYHRFIYGKMDVYKEIEIGAEMYKIRESIAQELPDGRKKKDFCETYHIPYENESYQLFVEEVTA